MPWYKSGTVSVTLNSNAVIGASTAFIANSRVGDAFRGPDGGWYEVTNIASDTAMSIAPNYQGATNAAGTYALAPMQGYVKDSADALRALVNQFGGVLAVLGETPTQAGVRNALNLTNADGLPEGQTNKYATPATVRGITLAGLDLTVKTPVVATDTVLAALGKLQAGKAVSGANSDITEITGLTKPLSIVQGGVSAGYIEGLIMSWNSANSLSVGIGAAYVPGTGKVLQLTAPLTLSGLTLAASTWYHVYLYDNAGVAAIEAVTTAPAATYFGTARAKNLDASRRYIGSMLTDSAGGLYKCRFLSFGRVKYLASVLNAPFMVVAGNSTAIATVDCSSIVPVTCFEAEGVALNGASVGGIYISNSDVGGLSINIFLQAYAAGVASYTTVTLDASQRFTYAFDQTPNGLFRFRVAGYKYER